MSAFLLLSRDEATFGSEPFVTILKEDVPILTHPLFTICFAIKSG